MNLQKLALLHYETAAPQGGRSTVTPRIASHELAPFALRILPFVDAPALSPHQLPDDATLTYTLVEGNDPTFQTVAAATIMGTQTGAGGAGAIAAQFAARPKYVGEFIGLRITASETANAAGLPIRLLLAAIP